MSEQRPDFLLVCDHGIRDGDLDPAALLPWFPDRPGWWAAEDIDAHVRTWLMEGNRRGWRPWRLVDRTAVDDDPRREAIEIPCPTPRCHRRAYRSDAVRLNTLLTAIAADEAFRAVFAVHADDTVIVVALDALHLARATAKRRFGMRV